MGPLGDPRFEVQGELGRGAETVVLRVVDRVHGAERALKLADGPGQLSRFRHEYFRLSELRHPYIVAAHDFGVTPRGMPYYTMELVRGADLGALAGRADPELLAVVALQALEALGVLHARGLVHRDLKPRNLLVQGSGAAAHTRLIDLGLAVRAGRRSVAAGTLAYMAPEVARGEDVDGRADLYSLGALLYEALLPEEAARTLEDIARRLRSAPPPPVRENPLVPTSLSAFVMRLLEPDRRARFQSAGEAADALARGADLELRRGPPRGVTERLMHAGAVSHRSSVVSRLRRIAAATAASGRGGVWFIEAPVGLGKTPLLRELAMVLDLVGVRTLSFGATSSPASPLSELVRAAVVLAPEVAGASARSLSAEAGLTAHEAAATPATLGPTLARALSRRPTALLIDDLHLCEPFVLEVVANLGRAAEGLPLVVVGAGEPRADSAVAAALTVEPNILRLGPLTGAEVARLAAHRLRGLELPAPALARLVHDSQGMPSLVERTLARLLVDRAVLRQGLRWVFKGGDYRPARHDASNVAPRMAALESPVRETLWAAAVLDNHFDVATVATVAGVSAAEVVVALQDLTRLDLIEPAVDPGRESYRFWSRSTASAVYQSIPAARRRELHDRAALVTAADATGAAHDEHLEHVLRGSDDVRAVAAAVQAAEREVALHADRRAIEHYLRALARVGGRRDLGASRLALQVGTLHARVGELEQARSWLEEVAAQPDEPGLAVEASLGLATVALRRGMVNEAEAQAQRATELLPTVPVAVPALAAALERLCARLAAERGEPDRAEALLREALAVYEAAGSEADALETLLELARLTRGRGDLPLAVRYARRALQRGRRVADAAAVAEASVILGRGLLRGGRVISARRVLGRGLRVARASADRLREAQALRQLAELDVRSGDLEVGVERYTQALELARGLRARADEAACLRDIGAIRGRLGEFKPALIALHAAHDLARSVGDVAGEAHAEVGLAHAYARLGHLVSARAFALRASSSAAALRDPALAAECEALRAFVALGAGDPAPAEAVGPYVLDRLPAIDDPGRRAPALLYAARCALRLGWAQTARRLGERLAEVVEVGPRRDYAAATRALLGRVALSLGERDRADELLASAAALAAQGGLRPLEADIRAALGELHAGSDRGAEELTRAMELSLEIASRLPSDLIGPYLARADALSLRAAFGAERARLLGPPAAAPAGLPGPTPAS